MALYTFAAVAVLTAFFALGSSAAPPVCVPEAVTLTPCVQFFLGSTSGNLQTCCLQLGVLVQSERPCICAALKNPLAGQLGSSSSSLNQTQTNLLNILCGIDMDSQCNDAESESAPAPAAPAAPATTPDMTSSSPNATDPTGVPPTAPAGAYAGSTAKTLADLERSPAIQNSASAVVAIVLSFMLLAYQTRIF